MFHERLKIARNQKGWSLRALATQLGDEIGAQALGKYERGEMKPSSTVLLKLSAALGVTPAYLLNPQGIILKDVDFRKKASTSVKEHAQVQATVLDSIDRYIQIEKISNYDSREWNKPWTAKIDVRNFDDVEKAAARLRKEWKLGKEPLRNVTALLEEKKLKVIILDMPDSVHGLTCEVLTHDPHYSIRVIIANANCSLERRRLTLLHELGHALLNPVGMDEKTSEKMMHRFGAAVLCDATHLHEELGAHRQKISLPELLILKKLYIISGAAFIVRLRDLKIISEENTKDCFMTFASSWRKTEPDPIETPEQRGKMEPATRFERLVYAALAEGWISKLKAAELLKIKAEDVRVATTGDRREAASSDQ